MIVPCDFSFFFFDYSVKYTKAKKSSVHSNGVKLHIMSRKETKNKNKIISSLLEYINKEVTSNSGERGSSS